MSTRLKEIDGLRALAVIGVLVFHFDKAALPHGYLGVDIFFAISGYVITRSIFLQIDAGKFSLNTFFMRRIKRLFPALSLMVMVSTLLFAMIIPRTGGIKTGLAAIFGMSNIALWYAGADYFGISTQWNPLTHTWSLGVEEQFYLVFPILFLALRQSPNLILGLLGMLCAASLAGYLFAWSRSPLAAFYLPVFRFWELLAGALVYFSSRALPRGMDMPYRNIGCYALMALLAVTLFATGVAKNQATVLCVVFTCALLFLCSQPGQTNPLLVHPAAQFVGKISYALYLWHWPVAIFVKLTLPAELLFPVYVLATAALSIGSYHLVERPLRQASWKLTRESALLTFPTVAIVSTSIIAMLWTVRPALFLGPAAMLERSFIENSFCNSRAPNGWTTCLKTGGPNKSMWLLGDSHAANFLPPLKVISERTGHRLQHPTGLQLFLSMTDHCTAGACQGGSTDELLARMGRMGAKGDIVVLSFSAERLWTGADVINRFQASLERLAEQMTRLGFKVMLIEDIPRVCASDGEYFSSVLYRDACLVSATESRARRQALSSIYQNVARQGHAKVFDLHDELCEKFSDGRLQCGNWKNGQLLYLDASPHLTLGASLMLTDALFKGLLHE